MSILRHRRRHAAIGLQTISQLDYYEFARYSSGVKWGLAIDHDRSLQRRERFTAAKLPTARNVNAAAGVECAVAVNSAHGCQRHISPFYDLLFLAYFAIGYASTRAGSAMPGMTMSR